MKQICDLAHCSERDRGIILPSMQQQPNSVFVIAFAVDILNGLAEIRKHVNVRKMMLHLLKCLEEKLKLFPRSPKHN